MHPSSPEGQLAQCWKGTCHQTKSPAAWGASSMTKDDRESTQMALLDRKTQGGRDLRSNFGYGSGSGSGDSHDEEDGDREVVTLLAWEVIAVAQTYLLLGIREAGFPVQKRCNVRQIHPGKRCSRSAPTQGRKSINPSTIVSEVRNGGLLLLR